MKLENWQKDIIRRAITFRNGGAPPDREIEQLIRDEEFELEKLPDTTAAQEIYMWLFVTIARYGGDVNDLPILITEAAKSKVDLQRIGAIAMLNGCVYHNAAVVEFLLSRDFDFNLTIRHGVVNTSAIEVFETHHSQWRPILEKIVGYEFMSEMHAAAEDGNISGVKKSIKELQAIRSSIPDARYQGAMARSLFLASNKRHWDVVVALIILGAADVNKAIKDPEKPQSHDGGPLANMLKISRDNDGSIFINALLNRAKPYGDAGLGIFFKAIAQVGYDTAGYDRQLAALTGVVLQHEGTNIETVNILTKQLIELHNEFKSGGNAQAAAVVLTQIDHLLEHMIIYPFPTKPELVELTYNGSTVMVPKLAKVLIEGLIANKSIEFEEQLPAATERLSYLLSKSYDLLGGSKDPVVFQWQKIHNPNVTIQSETEHDVAQTSTKPKLKD